MVVLNERAVDPQRPECVEAIRLEKEAAKIAMDAGFDQQHLAKIGRENAHGSKTLIEEAD
jgi:hypothetical protein